ncbi:MAG: peptide/nickel transport system permease protein [Gemmatimonadales bacterium]|nr:peptide/nickel transport system permease protein [Gemmatimonadales bacterium]
MRPVLDALAAAWRHPQGRVGALILLIVAVTAIVGPWLLPDPLSQPDILAGSMPPGLGHPFGTDQLNRDILSRVVTGARVSLSVALLAVALSMTLGAAVGLVAGYLGGVVDAALMRLVDGALAIPRLFILLLVLAVWERVPVLALVLLIGATGWFATSRIVRAEVLRLREEAYVRAAEALGARRRRIIFRHLLPNVVGPLLVTATLAVGDVILLEAGLSFLGLGIQPPMPSWGGMILDSKEVLVSAPWAGIFPGLAIVITVLSANLFGDALRDAVDPRSA